MRNLVYCTVILILLFAIGCGKHRQTGNTAIDSVGGRKMPIPVGQLPRNVSDCLNGVELNFINRTASWISQPPVFAYGDDAFSYSPDVSFANHIAYLEPADNEGTSYAMYSFTYDSADLTWSPISELWWSLASSSAEDDERFLSLVNWNSGKWDTYDMYDYPMPFMQAEGFAPGSDYARRVDEWSNVVQVTIAFIVVGDGHHALYWSSMGYNIPPSAEFSWSSYPPSRLVWFDGSDSNSWDGTPLSYEWDFDYTSGEETGIGWQPDSYGTFPSHEYTSAGTYNVWLRVTRNGIGKSLQDTFVDVVEVQ